MTSSSELNFKQNYQRNYQTILKYLKLKGTQPKTVQACSLAMQLIPAYFDYRLDELAEA